MALDASRSD